MSMPWWYAAAMIAAQCTGCGAGLDPSVSGGGTVRCNYCGRTHHAPLGATQMSAAIRAEVAADRNHNGIPDVFEQPAPAAPRGASVGPALGLGIFSVFVLGVLGALFSLREGSVSAPVVVAVPAAPPPVVSPVVVPIMPVVPAAPVAPVPVVLPLPTRASTRTPKSAGKRSSPAKPAAEQGATDVTPLALCTSRAASICASYGEPDCAAARARCNGM